tara:strand:- start:91 stop:372 length:282 start_codon:yes stop_codon:yes gene_type:complete
VPCPHDQTQQPAWLKKGANYKFRKTHPQTYSAFLNLSFTTPQIGSMAALVDVDGMTHQDAAEKWLADNDHEVGLTSSAELAALHPARFDSRNL